MSWYRRIAAACALIAVVAMGVAAPAQSGTRRDGAAASAGGLDTALVAASARRTRASGPAPEIDGRAPGRGAGPFSLFHPLWLTAAPPYPTPAAALAGALAPAPMRAPATPLLASRTSRGPPSRS